MLETHEIFSGTHSREDWREGQADSSLIKSSNDREATFGGVFSFGLSHEPFCAEAKEIREVADTLLGLQRRTVLEES